MRRLGFLLVLLLAGCSRFGPVYPSRPGGRPTAPLADPSPSRVSAHLAVTGAELRRQLDELVPKSGQGTFPLLGSARAYRWTRDPLDVSFASGKIVVKTHVASNVELPISSVDLAFDVTISAEPVVNTAYVIKLQSTDVAVKSDDRRLKIVDQLAGVFQTVGSEIDHELRGFSYDLAPLLAEAYQRVKMPLALPMGQAAGCAELRVLGVEAAPLILADGVEKDFSLVVSPTITLPCTPALDPSPLPPLANVAMVPTGPFVVTIPVAASYEELTRAMGGAFTNGKLFFSNEHPKLYLERPEIYEAEGALVLRLHIAGPVREFGIDADINGDLYLVGHPSLTDNEITFPDLEPTIETSNFLLSLKALSDGDRIKMEARKALRLDLADRLAAVRAKLSSDLTFGDAKQCFVANVDKLELTELHAHASYLRVNVVVTARASASLPCATPLPAAPDVNAEPTVTPVEPTVTPAAN
ncbi:MAG TPA: DUF4403 family protein [Polyangiaceae bacterium]|jgi:hypothetical protein|nr:DUF4403 family protein [Polyangiaceae bacterium]